MEPPSKLFAAVLGLTAFVIAVVAGLLGEVPGQVVLVRAMISMLVCYVVGIALGAIAGRAISDFTERYKTEHAATDLRAVAAEYSVSSGPASAEADSSGVG